MMFARPIGEAEVARIAALPEPVFRNLWITTAYHDLGLGMARLLGGVDVGWTTFATWASKTAGLSIRKEVLAQLVNAVLRDSPSFAPALDRVHLSGPARLAGLDIGLGIAGAVDDAVDAVSRQVAEGNLTVFGELGPLFSRMVAAGTAGPANDTARRDAFLATVSAADGDAEATRRLRQAFLEYWAAMTEPGRAARAQRILLANTLVGLTEQMHLQPNIAGALDAPFEESLTGWVERTAGHIGGVLLRGLVDAALRAILPELERVWREVVTEHLMTITTPDGNLLLGRDVPGPGAGAPLFPPDLQSLQNPDLVALLAQLDQTRGSGHGSGAHDWASLPDRMDYIVNLFRSRQQRLSFLGPPFTDAQWDVMQQGNVPPGPL